MLICSQLCLLIVSHQSLLCVQIFTSPDLSLQVHTVLTNLWLLLMLLITVFLSLDYGMPIVWRQEVTINIDVIMLFFIGRDIFL